MKTLGSLPFKKKPLVHLMSCILAASAFGVIAEENTEEAAEDKVEKVTVVGSRIRSGGFDEARPVDIILSSDALDQGIGDVASLLRSTTAAAGSSQITAASSTAFVQSGGEGAETLSLRGLGANRTLVLLNGRRAGPAGTKGEVSSFDFNVLPLSIVERIEILKDGASSVYGSDAVAGVVNIITKKLDGGNIEMSTTRPGDSGGEEFRINATYGKTFDRGSFMMTVDYNRGSELQNGQRDYFNCGEQFIFDADSGARADVIDPRTGSPSCNDSVWGHIWLYDYQEEGGNVPGSGRSTLFQYDYDNDLGNYVPGVDVDPNNPDYLVTPPGWFPVGYSRESDGVTNRDHPFQDQTSLIPELTRSTIYMQGDYELSDSHTLYAEALVNRRKLEVNGYRQVWGYIYNESSNGVAPDDPTSVGWSGSNFLSPLMITDMSDSNNDVDYRRWVLGFTGDVGEWYYDVSYQDSHSSGSYGQDVVYNDSVRDQNWTADACSGSTSSVRGVPCLDIPWLDPSFLAGNVPDDIRSYMFGYETGNTTYDQTTLEGYISGDLFEMPAGTVGAVFGVSLREDEINDVPSVASQIDNLWGSTSAGITAGSDKTFAYYTEMRLPILENIDIDISARYTDVDSYGSDSTYKIGINWAITDTVRFRASRGTSFRSPALYELYLANQKSFLSQRAIDPCINWGESLDQGAISQNLADNCAADGLPSDFAGGAADADIISGGGAGVLNAETSLSRTAGFIWTPGFADISVSVDYFSFNIEDEVTKLEANNILFRCYDSEQFATDPICDQFDRDPANQGIAEVRDQFINIASQANRGYDVAVNYNFDTEYGRVRLDTQHTFQLESSQALFTDTVVDTNGEFGDPEHVATFTASLSKDNWSATWGINYIGSVSNKEAYFDRVGKTTGTYRGEEYGVVISSSAIYYHSFSFNYDFEEYDTNVIVGVANAFDKKPPQITTLNLGEINTQGKSAFYSQYDWRGRRMFVNVSYSY
jgi:iron complex outermembrane receptor protein